MIISGKSVATIVYVLHFTIYEHWRPAYKYTPLRYRIRKYRSTHKSALRVSCNTRLMERHLDIIIMLLLFRIELIV